MTAQLHLAVSFVIILSFQGVSGLKWTAKPQAGEEIVVPACLGKDLSLFWNYTLDAGEHVQNVQWYFTAPGKDERVIATYVEGNFVVVPDLEQELTFQPPAGIVLHNATQAAAGRYMPRVNVVKDGSMTQHAYITSVDIFDTCPRNCLDVQAMLSTRASGEYTIFPDNSKPAGVRVFCDQATSGGGWTVFQRREDGSVDFYRNWTEYENGFGNMEGEFWLGLASIHLITSQEEQILRIDMEDFRDGQFYAEYSNFSISGPADFYRLHIGQYSGNATDQLGTHDNAQFTTKDEDHDQNSVSNCATYYKGGYWYHSCIYSNLNGLYRPGGGHGSGSMVWYRGDPSLRTVAMKMRPLV